MEKAGEQIALCTALALLLTVSLTACSKPTGQADGTQDSTGTVTTVEPEQQTEDTTEDTRGVDTTAEETTEAETEDAEPVDAAGDFRCGTDDKYFDLLVRWTAQTTADGVRLRVSVYLTSWTVFCNVRRDNYISINGEKTTFRSEKIDVGDRFTETLLGQTETVLPAGTASADIEAAFHYNGSYSDVAYEWLTASEVVSFNGN